MTILNRREFLLMSAAAAALSRCATTTAAEPAAARQLYDVIFERMLQVAPELATGLGLDTGPRAALKHRLSDASPAGKLGIYQPIVDALPQLLALDRDALGAEAARVDTVRWIAERIRDAGRFPYGEIGGYSYPVPYVLSQLTGSYQSVPDFLDSQHKVETRDDADAYLSRLEYFARNIALESERALADAATGVVPPAFILEKTLAQTRTLRDERGDRSGLVQSLARRTREKGIAGDWTSRAAAIVDGPLASALDRQIAAVTEMLRRPGATGASNLPDGAAYYQVCLRFHTSTSLSPQEAHAIGL